MRLFILRHAIAVPRGAPGYPNDDRPLTEKGIEKMKKAALGMARIAPKPDVILTSPLVRASRTAQIAADALGYGRKVAVCQELLPGTKTETLLKKLAEFRGEKNVLIVGHEPDLGELAGFLLGIRPEAIVFRKGGLCRIDSESRPVKRGSGRLIWHLKPKILRRLAEAGLA